MHRATSHKQSELTKTQTDELTNQVKLSGIHGTEPIINIFDNFDEASNFFSFSWQYGFVVCFSFILENYYEIDHSIWVNYDKKCVGLLQNAFVLNVGASWAEYLLLGQAIDIVFHGNSFEFDQDSPSISNIIRFMIF